MDAVIDLTCASPRRNIAVVTTTAFDLTCASPRHKIPVVTKAEIVFCDRNNTVTQTNVRAPSPFPLNHVKEECTSFSGRGVKTEDSFSTSILSRRWATRAEAVTSLKLHSTMLGKKIILDRIRSGKLAVVMVCSTHGQIHVGQRFACSYRVVLRKSKAKSGSYAKFPWAIKQGYSKVMDLKVGLCNNPPSLAGTTAAALQHSTNCCSCAMITVRTRVRVVCVQRSRCIMLFL